MSFKNSLGSIYHQKKNIWKKWLRNDTLPETNMAPENGWLEYWFPLGMAYFQGRTVSFREGKLNLWLKKCHDRPLRCWLSEFYHLLPWTNHHLVFLCFCSNFQAAALSPKTWGKVGASATSHVAQVLSGPWYIPWPADRIFFLRMVPYILWKFLWKASWFFSWSINCPSNKIGHSLSRSILIWALG